MNTDTALNQDYEKILINTVRQLPPNRAEQLVDFARFLEAQILAEKLLQEETSEEINADNDLWDALMETNEAQYALEKLADEALLELREGKTNSLSFNDEGQIVPE